MKVSLVLLVTLVGLAACATNYQNYKVFKVLLKDEYQNIYFQSLSNSHDFDFWTKVNKVGKPVVVMVAPKSQVKFEDYLKVHGIEYEIIIKNVGETIENERNYHLARPKSTRITFDQYYHHDEMNAYLDELAQNYPDLVTLESIGQSYENRDMKVIKISTGVSDPPKPVIFVDAGIHAREWIAPAVALYLINQLVENSTENQNMIENVDWIVLPSANPDGYEFTWSDDRLWRKTVSKGEVCDGCDPNRNFDFHWMDVGADSWECSEIYAGKEPFSEVETRNLRDYILQTENIKAYLTLHSYGQYLLYPWGWTSDLPDNWQELDDLANSMNDAIKAVRGTEYEIGSSTNVLYAASGASDDWSMGVGGISIVYTIELPGGGIYGFDLPPEEIPNVTVETFEGFKVVADYIANNGK